MLDIHQHYTFIIIDVYYLCAAVLTFFLLPYILHGIGRWKQKRQRVICDPHVILGILLIIYHVLSTVRNNTFEQAIYLLAVLLALQILFVIYFCFAYFRIPTLNDQ